MKKTCKKCMNEKPIECFSTHNGIPNARPRCRECCSKEKRIERRKNPEKHLSYKYKNKFGLTIEDFKILLCRQGNKCAICNRDHQYYKKFCIDHDHETGMIRGILCWNCNVGLGHFKDSTENLKGALRYLSKNKNIIQGR